MNDAVHTLRKIANIYKTFAVIILNCCLALIFANVVAFGILQLSESHSVHEGKLIASPQWVDQADMESACYPGLPIDTYNAVRVACGTNPLEYSEYVQFKTPARSFGRLLNVHADGFRISSNQGPWPLNRQAINIFLFGGSTMFGYNTPDFFTISSYLQKALDSAQTPVKAFVYNFGQPFYFSTQERIFFQKLISQGHLPSIAIFVDGLNDINIGDQLKFTSRLQRIFESYRHDSSSLKDLFQSMALMKLTTKLLGKDKQNTHESLFNEGSQVAEDMQQDINKKLQRYFMNKIMIESMAAEFGVKTIFVWQPVPFYRYDTRYHYFLYETDPSPSFKRFQQAYSHMRLLWEGGKLGGNFLWLADIQKGVQKPLYLDFVHYGALLSEMVAKALHHHMENTGMLIK